MPKVTKDREPRSTQSSPERARPRNIGHAMYKRIIVAVDGSAISNRALREAVKLAKESRSQLRIVHVVDVLNVNMDTVSAWDAYEAALSNSGEQVLKHAAAAANKAGVKAQTRLLEVQQFNDRIADEIVREAALWEANLLVIGTHGRRGFSRVFLGSVAESVIRIASTPLLLVHGK